MKRFVIDEERQRAAISLYDHFTHNGMDRRLFMARMTALAGSAAAANALIGAIEASPAAAAIIAENDKRLETRDISWPVAPGRMMKGYRVAPTKRHKKLAAVIVVHENRGLNAHIRDVARRIALEGFVAIAPDFLSIAGGTPTDDEDKARTMIGALDMSTAIADGAAAIAMLRHDAHLNGHVGIVGFCWGGAMVNRLAIAAGADLDAAIAYYGPTPDPALASRVHAAMLLHYAGNDDRVNKGAQGWIDALKAAKVPVEAYFYPGVEHAFNNDTSAARYNKAAADLAWGRTIALFKAWLIR